MDKQQKKYWRDVKSTFERESEKHFHLIAPLIAENDQLNLQFFIQISTISATVGAFSFLIFERVPHTNLLVTGDLLLILNIIIGVSIYAVGRGRLANKYIESFFTQFERHKQIVGIANDFLTSKISHEKALKKYKDIGRGIRPAQPTRRVKPSSVVLLNGLFVIAMLLIGLSLVDADWKYSLNQVIQGIKYVAQKF